MNQPEPFRFTDADGDYLHIGIPASPTTGRPAISFHTMTEPVHVPVERIEELITALRRMVAVSSAGRAPATNPTTLSREAEAELYVLLRKAGEDRYEAQALIDRHRDEVLRRAAVLPEPAPTTNHADVLPAWEALYEPGNVSTYLIGYANDQDAATGMAEAWMRSQAEVTGRLEWVDDKQMATGRYDRWFELIERHDDGVDTGPGIIVRRRMADEPDNTQTHADEDPARIDRLRPEFTEHASVEAIDAQTRRAERQRGLWDARVRKLAKLREQRVAQEANGEWPAAGARQDEPWPVKEATRRYAEELRSKPSTVVADGHTGWDCDAGAQLLVSASTPGPGALGTHHGTIYACTIHQSAALQRITGSGYEADPQPAPPGHRWNPWPCGHVTAHDREALTALTATQARQDGATP